ncbi:hypothetical protein [Deinococcus sonorensis]|uniref:Uncharacterized protein n=2 Tax=Deinococcus sonorensis TaxID=309891 RepID=A0AAU7U5Z8_9DEIO
MEHGDPPPAALQGEWHFGYVSPIEYYDPTTGKYAEASGTSAILHLNPDGTFTGSSISVITVGACSTKLLVISDGLLKFNGQSMTKIDKHVKFSMLETCSGKVTTGGTLTNKTSTWKVEGEGDAAVLTITDDQGATGRWNRPRVVTAPGDPQPGKTYTLSGTLTAPSGHSLYGTAVIVCPKATGCEHGGDKTKWFKTGSELNATTWEIKGMTDEPYLVYAWQDVDHNKEFSVGDWFDKAFASGNGVITNPAAGTSVHFVMEEITEE